MFQKASELYYVQYESDRTKPKTGSRPVLYNGQVELVQVGEGRRNALPQCWASFSRSPNGTYLPVFGELSYEELRLEDHEAKETFQFTGRHSNFTIGQVPPLGKKLSNWPEATKVIKFAKTSRLKCPDGIDQVGNPTSSSISFTTSQAYGHSHDFTETQSCPSCNLTSGDKIEAANNQTDVKQKQKGTHIQNDIEAPVDGRSQDIVMLSEIAETIPMQGIEHTFIPETSTSEANRKKILPKRRKPISMLRDSKFGLNEGQGIFQNATACGNDFFKTTTKVVNYEKKKGGQDTTVKVDIHGKLIPSVSERNLVNDSACLPESISLKQGTVNKKLQSPESFKLQTPAVFPLFTEINALPIDNCYPSNPSSQCAVAKCNEGANVKGEISYAHPDFKKQYWQNSESEGNKGDIRLPRDDTLVLGEYRTTTKSVFYNTKQDKPIPVPASFINQPSGKEKMCINESTELDDSLCHVMSGANRRKASVKKKPLIGGVSCKTTDENSNIEITEEINKDLNDNAILPDVQPMGSNHDSKYESKHSYKRSTNSNYTESRQDEITYKTIPVGDSKESESNNVECILKERHTEKGPSKISRNVLKEDKFHDNDEMQLSSESVETKTDEILSGMDSSKPTRNVLKENEFRDQNETQLSLGSVEADTDKMLLKRVNQNETELSLGSVEAETDKMLLKRINAIGFREGTSHMSSEINHLLLGHENNQKLDKQIDIHNPISEKTNKGKLQLTEEQHNHQKSTHLKSSSVGFANPVRHEIRSVSTNSFTSSQNLNSTFPIQNINYDDCFMFCRNDFEDIFDNSSFIELDLVRNPFADKIVNITPSDQLIGSQYIRIKDRIVIVIPHGKGTLQTDDGNVVYCGEFIKGKRNGFGSATILPSGDSMHIYAGYYQGNWKNNYRHGHGKMAFLSGRLYEGAWYLDKMHGKGTLRMPDGSLIEGYFIDGKPDGYCTFTESDRLSELRKYYLGQLVSPGADNENEGDIQRDDSNVNARKRVTKQCYFNADCHVNEQQFRLQTSRLVQCIQNQTSDLLNQHVVLLQDTCRDMLKESINQIAILTKSSEKPAVTPSNDLGSLKQEIEKMNLGLNNLTSRCNDVALIVTNKQKNVEDVLKSLQGNLSSEICSRDEMSSLRQEIKRIKEEKEKLEDLTKCQICHENTRDCIIMPCMHMKTCSQCLRTIRNQNRDARCPICRGPIQGEIHCKL